MKNKTDGRSGFILKTSTVRARERNWPWPPLAADWVPLVFPPPALHRPRRKHRDPDPWKHINAALVQHHSCVLSQRPYWLEIAGWLLFFWTTRDALKHQNSPNQQSWWWIKSEGKSFRFDWESYSCGILIKSCGFLSPPRSHMRHCCSCQTAASKSQWIFFF